VTVSTSRTAPWG